MFGATRRDATRGEKPTRPRDDIKSWLENRLGSGPVSFNLIRDEAESMGFNERTLWRTKKDMGIKSRHLDHGGRKVSHWILDGSD